MTQLKYKPSIYNNIYRKNDKNYLYHSFSGHLCIITDEYREALGRNDFSVFDEDTRKTFIRKGILVNETLDEFGSFYAHSLNSQFTADPSAVFIMISTTGGCNYHCPYYLQGKHDEERDVEDRTIRYLTEYIRSLQKTLKKVHITWFGGEPLAKDGCIEKISKAMISLCEENRIEYAASIITDGSLLFPSINKLHELHIRSVQVTFDGNEEVSCARKGCTEIQHRLAECAVIIYAKAGIDISVRFNVDESNIDSCIEEAIILCSETIRTGAASFRCYPALIGNGGKEIIPDWGLNAKLKFIHALAENGFISIVKHLLPKARFTSCGALCDANIYIDEKGNFFRCEHHVGCKEKECGNVFTGKTYSSFYNSFHDLTIPEKCRKCSLYPVCRQGCFDDRFQNGASMNCENFHTYIENIISLMDT